MKSKFVRKIFDRTTECFERSSTLTRNMTPPVHASVWYEIDRFSDYRAHFRTTKIVCRFVTRRLCMRYLAAVFAWVLSLAARVIHRPWSFLPVPSFGEDEIREYGEQPREGDLPQYTFRTVCNPQVLGSRSGRDGAESLRNRQKFVRKLDQRMRASVNYV